MADISRILIIDDSFLVCAMVERSLRIKNVEIVSAHTTQEAFDSIEEQTPDLILLDVILPSTNGYELCARLKDSERLAGVPIIFLTAQNDECSILQGFEAGAVDYISKPFSAVELNARVRAHLQNKLMADQLRIANEKLERMMEEIRQQGLRDPLTNLYNRRYFLEHSPEWEKQAVEGRVFSLMMGDLDDFKHINDTYGHSTGDYVLYTVSDILNERLGNRAIVCRWGGEEFLAVLVDTPAAQAAELAERARQRVAEYQFSFDKHSFDCTMTMGVAQVTPGIGVDRNLERADEALYQGKKQGKNLVVIWEGK